MGIRESLNKNPKLATGMTVALVLACVGFVIFQQGGAGASLGAAVSEVYFSDDDGKTYFTDSVDKKYPFDRNGKQAVRAYVFKCGDSGAPAVTYLERVRDNDGKPPAGDLPGQAPSGIVEVKKPGQKDWVRLDTAAGTAVVRSDCPGGPTGSPVPVFP